MSLWLQTKIPKKKPLVMRESYNQEVLRSEWKVCHAAIIDTKFCALCNKGTVFLLQTALHKAHHYLAQIHTSLLPLHFLSPHFACFARCCTKLSPTWFQLSTTYVRLHSFKFFDLSPYLCIACLFVVFTSS